MKPSVLSEEELKTVLEIRHSLENLKSNLQDSYDSFKIQEAIKALQGIEFNHERL